MKRLLVVACFSLVLCITQSLPAQVKVGDKPTLQVDAVGGGKIDLAVLKGKIVVVDFWATWCGPCMQEAPHMVAVNQKYAGQGLQIVGISLDQNTQKMTQVAQQQGFTWPQYCDGHVWQSVMAKTWGVEGIPQTFLIGPDGTVLWTGHPGELDAPLADAFKNHPPRLVDPKVLLVANAKLDEATKALEANDARGAIRVLAQVPAEASDDGAFAARSADVRAKLEISASALLAEVDPMIVAKQYTEAATKLEDLILGLKGSDTGIKARQKLTQLEANPDAKTAIDLARREQLASTALTGAQKLQADKKDTQAYAAYKDIAARYVGTPSATTAADAVKVYEQNPAFVKAVNEATIGAKAKGMLSIAASYHEAHKDDLAKAKYQAVIDQFPGTSYAETAQKALTDIGN